MNGQEVIVIKKYAIIPLILTLFSITTLIQPAIAYALPNIEIIVDNPETIRMGDWRHSKYVPGYYGDNYVYSMKGDGSETATWTFNLTYAGQWEVYAIWTNNSVRATNSPYTINHALARARVLTRDLFIYTITLGIVDLLKVFFFRGVGGVAASTTAISRLTTLQSYWADTVMGLMIMFDGLYSNLLLLGLAILGILVSRPKRFFDHYIEIFLGLSSLVFLVGDATIKSRVFYNFPIGFLAAYGFLSVYRREDKTFRWFFGYFVASAMLVYLFRGLANIV